MNLSALLAKHLREVHTGGNWTTSNLKDNLSGITWQQATTQVYNLNTIAALVYHIHYYIAEVTKVLQGQPLTASDKYSYAVPPIQSQEEWETLCHRALSGAETFAALIEQFPEEQLYQDFADPRYGSYYRNLQGIIEHTHYHLGQIALIKKILLQQAAS